MVRRKYSQPILDGDNYGDCVGLSGVSVDEELLDEVAFQVDVFHLLGCDVLSLLELKNVLLSIDYSHSVALRNDLPNVSSLQPPIS